MGENERSGIRLLDIDDPARGLLAYATQEGQINEDLVDAVYQRFDAAKASGTKIRVYAEMSAIPSVDASMILDKLKRLGTIMSTVERMAIVGDAGWLDIYAKVIDPITRPDIKHFTTDQSADALAWLHT